MTRLEHAYHTVMYHYDTIGKDQFFWEVEKDCLPSAIRMAYKDLNYVTDGNFKAFLKGELCITSISLFVI